MLTSSQAVLVLSPSAEEEFYNFFMENLHLKSELDKNLSHAKVTLHPSGFVLFEWSTVFWDQANDGIRALENLLFNLTCSKQYKFIRIGEQINDMVCFGELNGPPFYVGYRRQIVFIDSEAKTRCVSAGAVIE